MKTLTILLLSVTLSLNCFAGGGSHSWHNSRVIKPKTSVHLKSKAIHAPDQKSHLPKIKLKHGKVTSTTIIA
jgi:hypothetical protein